MKLFVVGTVSDAELKDLHDRGHALADRWQAADVVVRRAGSPRPDWMEDALDAGKPMVLVPAGWGLLAAI